MIVDYLRYVAFAGRLRDFFERDLFEYVEPEATTGQHLRFAPEYIEKRLGWRGQTIVRDLHWDPHARDMISEELKEKIGVATVADGLTRDCFRVGERPPTHLYVELRAPHLEIVVDIDPHHWSEKYLKRSSYHETPIIYRRSGPAIGTIKSGAIIQETSRTQNAQGTLCGVFYDNPGPTFALTCGHVVGPSSEVTVERALQIWKLPLGSHFAYLGKTIHHSMYEPGGAREIIKTRLDAALVKVKAPATLSQVRGKAVRPAAIKPISSVLQEEPVAFRGAGRPTDTLARISAVTIRKSIDASNDGRISSLADALMLGHRQPMYISQPISRSGDSGAALRQGFSFAGSVTKQNQWYGMIVGGDETSAYATHAESLWAWAAEATSNHNLEFAFEI
ncbi:hypothetical protein [Bradyrhizobium retamae]|uniref:Uncharacterized protein n=1 Tax=Bradyrhizobium retamae TaxID=1300035 RepID=A0A0R3M504_9BRAD|nr:hypothetical protein [Bradyrhizobium retamae]KRR15009.1 hypothetical protein CQ13_37540 [Bradyrhizobium retamae]